MPRNACPNCSCGYNTTLNSGENLSERTVKARELSNILKSGARMSIENLREELLKLGISINIDGVTPFLYGDTTDVCGKAREIILQILSHHKLTFYSIESIDIGQTGC